MDGWLSATNYTGRRSWFTNASQLTSSILGREARYYHSARSFSMYLFDSLAIRFARVSNQVSY